MTDNSTPMTRQEREWQQRRQDILEAAARLFAAHGWAGATMQMIADEAEFSVGYLYKQFPGKLDLLDAIVTAELERYKSMRARVHIEYEGRPLDALRQELRRSMDMLASRSSLVPLFITFESENASQVRPIFQRFLREDTALLAEAVSQGLLNAQDAELLAAVYNGMTWGVIRWMSGNGSLDRLGEIPEFIDRYLLDAVTRAPGSTEGKDDTSS